MLVQFKGIFSDFYFKTMGISEGKQVTILPSSCLLWSIIPTVFYIVPQLYTLKPLYTKDTLKTSSFEILNFKNPF